MVRFALLFVGAVVLAASNEEVTMERVQRKLDRLKARSGSMSSSSKHQLNDVLKRIMQIKDEATPEPEEPTAKKHHVGRKSIASQAAARLEAVFLHGPQKPPGSGSARPGSKRTNKIVMGGDRVSSSKLAALLRDVHEQGADLKAKDRPRVPPHAHEQRIVERLSVVDGEPSEALGRDAGSLASTNARLDADSDPSQALRVKLKYLQNELDAHAETRRETVRVLRDAYDQMILDDPEAADAEPLETRLGRILLPNTRDPMPSAIVGALATKMAAAA